MSAQKARAKNYHSGVRNCIHYLEYSTTSQNANILKLETVLNFSSLPFLLISPFTESNFFKDLNQFQNFVKNQLGDLLFQSGLPGSISSLQYSRTYYNLSRSCQSVLRASYSRLLDCLPFLTSIENLLKSSVLVSTRIIPIFLESIPYLLEGYFVFIKFLGGALF